MIGLNTIESACMTISSCLFLIGFSSAVKSSPNCAFQPLLIISVKECSDCYKISKSSQSSSSLKTTFSVLTSWRKMFACNRPTFSKTTAFQEGFAVGTLW